MNKRCLTKVVAIACVLVLSVVAFAGCASGANSAEAEAKQANRAYMSQVNETMNELHGNLDLFVDAVSRDDIVNMKTQTENAYKSLDKLEAIEAPEAMKEIHEHYVEGAKNLREALNGYIDLYSEVKTAGSDSSMSSAEFDKRVAAIQELYDAGVKEFEEADSLAAPEEAA